MSGSPSERPYCGLFLNTSDNQFGFKTGLGCSFAIRGIRNVVDGLTKGDSTGNLCALDLSTAFDKVNYHALYLKLMKRLIPNKLLNLLMFWLSRCCSCVKWIDSWSQFFDFDFGVRHGSVLSPFLFALLWPPYVIGRPLYFLPCSFFLSSFFLFFPRLISATGDRMSAILLHMAWP